jgi:tripartite-type tricarboxylate transporter receptor subunit TctC
MALIGGEIQMGFIPVQTLLPYVKSGQLVAIAVGEPQRMPTLPDLPTVAETLPGFDTAAWEGFIVPAGTPKEIVTRLREATLSIMRDPAIAKQFTDQQKIVMAVGPDEFADRIRKDSAKWEKVIKAAHIKVEWTRTAKDSAATPPAENYRRHHDGVARQGRTQRVFSLRFPAAIRRLS